MDPALAPLIPADTTTLIGARVDHLRNTPAWNKLFPAKGAIALERLQQQTGLDLRNGLYEAVVCAGGKHRLALIRGKFVDGGITNAGLEPQLKIPGAQKFPYKGFTLVGQEEQAVTYFNSSVFIAGRAAALRAVIDSRELKNTTPKALLALVDSLPAHSHFYAVSTQPTIPEGGIGGVRSLPVSLSQVKTWLDLSAGAALHFEATGATPEDAQKLHDGIKGILSILKMTLKGDQRDLLTALESMRLGVNGNLLTLEADLPMDALARTLESFNLLP